MKTDSNIKRVNQKRVKVLGVGIDDVTMEEAMEIVEGWICHPELVSGSPSLSGKSLAYARDPDLRQDDNKCHAKLIFTPGPEFLVTAQNDPEFMKILNAADLNIPDGYGLKIFGNITNVVPGVDFMLALCKLAAEKSFTVGLLGGTSGVAKKTKDKLETMFPGIKITFAIDGEDADRVVAGYDALRYVDILFVALGHPKQEKYLNVILERAKRSDEQARGFAARIYFGKKILSGFALQNDGILFRVGMGVGGSFDFISGKVPEPGTIYNSMGLKWLGRFLTRPGYMLPKIIKAVVIFPLLILKERLQIHFP